MKNMILALGLALGAAAAHADMWKCGNSFQDHKCQAAPSHHQPKKADDEPYRRPHAHRHHGDSGGTTAPTPPATTPTPPATTPPATTPPTPTPAPPAASGTPVEVHGALAVKGNRIVDKTGQPVQLRGMSFGWSNWWGQYWTPGTVDWLIDDWKTEVIRASMGIEPAGAYLSNPAAERAKVVAVVDQALKRGAYVIIDWHEENAPKHIAQARAFFTDMATRYGNQPNVIYEIYNEPVNYSWSQIKTYAIDIVAAIRAQDPDNLIIVGTPNWSSDIESAAANPLVGSNIAYTFHFYAASHKQSARDQVSRALSKGIAVFVTEWGTCEASGTGTLDSAETNTWLQFLDQNKLSWTNWAISDKAGETCSALMPNSSPTGHWPASSLSADGNLMRGKLRTYAGVAP